MNDKRILILSVSLIVVSALLAFAILEVSKIKVKKIQQEVLKEKERNQIIVDILEAQEKVKDCKNFFPTTRDANWLIDEINTIVSASGIEMKFIEPQKEVDQGVFVKIPVVIGCVATFDQIGRFVGLVEGFPKYLVIDEIRITQLPKAREKTEEVFYRDKFGETIISGFFLEKPRSLITVATLYPKKD